ncbi:MAG: hypothetical protein WC428_01575 [Candidatus Paceibacterota bacterium]
MAMVSVSKTECAGSIPAGSTKKLIMKTLKKEKLNEILDLIVSEDPYCGVDGQEEALSKLIEYLNENDIEVK